MHAWEFISDATRVPDAKTVWLYSELLAQAPAHQRADMGDDRVRERLEPIAALERRDDAATGVTPGDLDHDPSE